MMLSLGVIEWDDHLKEIAHHLSMGILFSHIWYFLRQDQERTLARAIEKNYLGVPRARLEERQGVNNRAGRAEKSNSSTLLGIGSGFRRPQHLIALGKETALEEQTVRNLC